MLVLGTVAMIWADSIACQSAEAQLAEEAKPLNAPKIWVFNGIGIGQTDNPRRTVIADHDDIWQNVSAVKESFSEKQIISNHMNNAT